MRFWHGLVRFLVFAAASFFAVVGMLLLVAPLTGQGALMEPAPAYERMILAAMFLLAAAPMYYFVFSKTLAEFNPPRKKAPRAP